MIKFPFFKLRFLVIFFSFLYFLNSILFLSIGYFSIRITRREFGIIEVVPCDWKKMPFLKL